jgi:hypothetical protein
LDSGGTVFYHARQKMQPAKIPGGGLARLPNPAISRKTLPVHHVFAGGWIWVLKFNNGITSGGVAAKNALAGLQDYSRLTMLELDSAAQLVSALYAAMDRFDLFRKLSLLYFAAASFSETARLWRMRFCFAGSGPRQATLPSGLPAAGDRGYLKGSAADSPGHGAPGRGGVDGGIAASVVSGMGGGPAPWGAQARRQ